MKLLNDAKLTESVGMVASADKDVESAVRDEGHKDDVEKGNDFGSGNDGDANKGSNALHPNIYS